MLTLKRASKSRPGGTWSDDDYDVFDGDRHIGRILNALWHRAESNDDLVKPVLSVFPAALKEGLKAGPGPQPPIIRRSIANCIRRLMDRLRIPLSSGRRR
jgi:hypothetical protein